MDFYVYDNIMTFNKINPSNRPNIDRLIVNRIELPENGSFWFFTDMKLVQENVNIQKRYVHIHPGIGVTNKLRFDKTPKHVKRGDIIYNPKTYRVEIKGRFPWSKPIYAKKAIRYYGQKPPKKKMTIVGEIIYNHYLNAMHFIIDYFPQGVKFHWEEEDTDFEPPTFEQIARVEELEYKIKLAEEKIKNQT